MIPGVSSFCAAEAKLGEALVSGGEALHLLPASYGVKEGLRDLIGGPGIRARAGHRQHGAAANDPVSYTHLSSTLSGAYSPAASSRALPELIRSSG